MSLVSGLQTDGVRGRRFVATGSPRFGWQNDAGVHANRVLVASSEGDLLFRQKLLWDSGWISAATQVGYAGRPLSSRDHFVWTVLGRDISGAERKSEVDRCEVALTSRDDWEATWIGWPVSATGGAQYFRRPFECVKPAAARLYVTALGNFEAWINGAKIGDAVLDPAVTDTSRTILYQAYDVTDLLRSGANVLGLVATQGWSGRTAVLAQLEVDTPNGVRKILTGHNSQDGAWHVATGPVTAASIYDGETYDARLEAEGWSLPGDDLWGGLRPLSGACAVDPPSGELRLQNVEPIRVVSTRQPISLSRVGPTTWVADFGQNTAGWCRIRASEPQGAMIRIAHAETINADGTVNQQNLRSALATDVYISNGVATVWEPQWTYHGFRYAQIEGVANRPEIEMRIVRSDIATVARFDCGDAELNALESAVRWTESSNLHGIPTDCPQRDERMGWLNDLTVRAETTLYTFATHRLLAKFVDDIADTQDASGAIADTAPFRFGSRPADPVAACYGLIPLLLYRHYGDDRPIHRHLLGIRAWCDYLDSRSSGGLISYSHYGDWAPPELDMSVGANSFPLSATVPGVFVSSAHYVATRRALAELARVAGREDIAIESEQAGQTVADAVHAAFADALGYCGGSQAANSIALYLGITPDSHKKTTVNALVNDVRSRGRLTTGNLATKYILETLSTNGFGDLAMDLVKRHDYPSWLYMLDHGATTIWERWENAIGGGMNSHNHPMYGTVGAWLYRHLVGLRLADDAVGFSRIIIDPLLTTPVSRASLILDTVRGRAAVNWNRAGNKVTLAVVVPSGAIAQIIPISTTVGAGTHRFSFQLRRLRTPPP